MFTYVLLIYIDVAGRLEMTTAELHLSQFECLMLAEHINSGNEDGEIAACMPVLKD